MTVYVRTLDAILCRKCWVETTTDPSDRADSQNGAAVK